MLIQMIGGNVGNNRHVRTAVHAVKLKRTELKNRIIVLFHLRNFTEKRMTDVPAQMHAITGRLQKFGDDGRCCRLSVAPGHSNDPAGAEGKEHLHFGGNQTAPFFCGR